MSENGMSCADMAALMNNNGMNGANGMWNNPFMYLVWLALFRGNGGMFGGDGAGAAVAGADINSRLNSLSQQISDNQSTNTLGAGIAGNHEALNGINGTMNLGFAGTTAAINQASMTNMMGQKDAQYQMQQCCCENKSMGYETQLRDQANTAAITSRIDQLANGVQTGFANIGFLTQSQTNELNNTINTGNQRIIDTLNNHWTSDLQQKYSDAKLELSQLNQNATLIAALKTT